MEILRVTESEVRIGMGVLGNDLLPDRPGRSLVATITQPGSAPVARRLARWLRQAGTRCEVRVMADGEAAKSIEVATDLYQWLASLRLTRDDTLLCVGGGALTDVGGFVASTYLRGIESVLVPTSLVGALDAAIGGKTALNLGGTQLVGKNLVGTFWAPARVLIDLELLEALPIELRRQGMAEAAKAALVGDSELLVLLERDGLAAKLEEVVGRAVAVKARFVNADPRDLGIRAVLNYGHTLGHALEATAGLEHGTAVALGMVGAGAIAGQKLGFREEARQRALLAGLGLPVRLDDIDLSLVLERLQLDKKRAAEGIRMVLLRQIAEPVIELVSEPELLVGLAAVGVKPD